MARLMLLGIMFCGMILLNGCFLVKYKEEPKVAEEPQVIEIREGEVNR